MLFGMLLHKIMKV